MYIHQAESNIVSRVKGSTMKLTPFPIASPFTYTISNTANLTFKRKPKSIIGYMCSELFFSRLPATATLWQSLVLLEIAFMFLTKEYMYQCMSCNIFSCGHCTWTGISIRFQSGKKFQGNGNPCLRIVLTTRRPHWLLPTERKLTLKDVPLLSDA